MITIPRKSLKPCKHPECPEQLTQDRFCQRHRYQHERASVSICAIVPSKVPAEQYADQFASELLMPIKYLAQVAEKYTKEGFVSFKSALKIADCFGVSFSSCVNIVAYKLKLIDGDTTQKKLKNRIRNFKPI